MPLEQPVPVPAVLCGVEEEKEEGFYDDETHQRPSGEGRERERLEGNGAQGGSAGEED